MNTIYLVRHGENKANITKEFSYKKVDYPLTAKGILQAQQTAEFFEDKAIDEVYASPLRRARETAQIIASALGLPVKVIENFREVNVGTLEGRPPDAANWAIHNRIVADWYGTRPETTFPDGENYIQLVDRMRDGIQRIVGGKSDKNIVVVAHGGIITATMREICRNGHNGDVGDLLRRENHNCAITEIEFADAHKHLEGVLKAWASHSHLHGPAAELVTGSLKNR